MFIFVLFHIYTCWLTFHVDFESLTGWDIYRLLYMLFQISEHHITDRMEPPSVTHAYAVGLLYCLSWHQFHWSHMVSSAWQETSFWIFRAKAVKSWFRVRVMIIMTRLSCWVSYYTSMHCVIWKFGQVSHEMSPSAPSRVDLDSLNSYCPFSL